MQSFGLQPTCLPRSGFVKPLRRDFELKEKELGPWRFRPFYANQSSELNFPIFLGKKRARIQKKEGFIRSPPNRYGPSSSLSLSLRMFWAPQAPEAREDEILRFQPQEL